MLPYYGIQSNRMCRTSFTDHLWVGPICVKRTISLFGIVSFSHQLLSVLNPSVSTSASQRAPSLATKKCTQHLPCLLYPAFCSQSFSYLGMFHICAFSIRCQWEISLFWYFCIEYFHFRTVPLRARIKMTQERHLGHKIEGPSRVSISLNSVPWVPHLPRPSAGPGITTGKEGTWPKGPGWADNLVQGDLF